jgi:hypothetical protein
VEERVRKDRRREGAKRKIKGGEVTQFISGRRKIIFFFQKVLRLCPLVLLIRVE